MSRLHTLATQEVMRWQGALRLPFAALLAASVVLAVLPLLMAILSAGVNAQEPVTVEATIDPIRLTVGDRATYTVTVRADPSVQVMLPAPSSTLGDLEVIQVITPQTSLVAGSLQEIRLQYIVAGFRTGVLRTDHPPIQYTLPDGSTGSATIPVLEIGVASVLPPDATPSDVKDIKPPMSVTGEESLPLLRVAVGAAAVVVVGAIMLYTRRRWQTRPVQPELSPAATAPTPEATARAELDRIAALGLPQQGDYKTYYSLIARCIRVYLEERYHFPATAFTRSELPRQMALHHVDRRQAQMVVELLAECDAVNYAQYRPATARAYGDLQVAYAVVDADHSEAAASTATAVPADNQSDR